MDPPASSSAEAGNHQTTSNNNGDESPASATQQQQQASDVRKHIVWAVALVVVVAIVASVVGAVTIVSLNSNDNRNSSDDETDSVPSFPPTVAPTKSTTLSSRPTPAPTAAFAPSTITPDNNNNEFLNEDPFDNIAGPEDAVRWRTNGQGGLELTIVNALEPTWYQYFYTAVAQWDNGTPDTLTLTVQERGSSEPACRAEAGILKVCNGNYGPTQWRGISSVLLQDGLIYSATARLNDYYFGDNETVDFAQKSFEMCHNIGHGFGLPHTDENFFNADLFDCMDFTNNPEANMQPNTSNFLFLEQMYGTVPSG